MNHVDTAQTITHVSLCAGYGGIDLGLKRAIPGLRSVALCEIEAFAIANLVAKMEAGLMDPAPVWTNLKTFPWAEFRGRVDILSGGYPCQPFSAAGKRLGKDDPRHLWPYIADGIDSMRPQICFFENVEGHISLGLPDVIEDLAGLGYRTTWGIFSASEIGAPHQRKRVFILAHRNGSGLQGDVAGLFVSSRRKMSDRPVAGCCGSSGSGELANADDGGGWKDRESGEPRTAGIEQSSCIEGRGCAGEVREGEAWPSRPGEPQHHWEPPRVVADAERGRRKEPEHQHTDLSPEPGGRDSETMGNSGGKAGKPNGGQAKPTLGGDADGSAGGLDYAELCVTCDNRTDELRLLGNGVVPATAERAFITLIAELAQP